MWILVVLIIAAIIVAVVLAVWPWPSDTKKRDDEKLPFVKDEKPSFIKEDEERLRHSADSAASFGTKGEMLVQKRLEEVKNRYGGYLYHDFCFEDENGYSSEIDHILITRGGVFIIETKSNKGTIRGKENDDSWRSLKENCPAWKYFKNPIKQNQRHVNHLRQTIEPNPPRMKSMVVFPFADVSQIDSGYVYQLDEAIDAIEEATASKKCSSEFVERVNH